MRPHYSHSRRENATPSSDTSPLASCKGVPPPGGEGKLVLILQARSLPRSGFCRVTQRSSLTWRQKRLSGRLASKLCVWKSRESEVIRTRVTGLARERKDLGSGISRRFGIFSCCLLSSAQVLTCRRALTFENELKRCSSTLPMFVSVFKDVLNDVYFF